MKDKIRTKRKASVGHPNKLGRRNKHTPKNSEGGKEQANMENREDIEVESEDRREVAKKWKREDGPGKGDCWSWNAIIVV